MEQVTLPEGEERRLLVALLTTKGVPRKPVTVAVAAGLVSGSTLPQNVQDLEAVLVRLVADQHGLEVRLNQKLDQLSQLIAPHAQSKPGANGKQVESAIPAAIRQADQQGRHGGLVPIPEVRRLVLQQTGATRAQFDQALLAMERDFRVDLKIADDPRRPDAPEGIQVPGRGLVYYALRK